MRTIRCLMAILASATFAVAATSAAAAGGHAAPPSGKARGHADVDVVR